MENDEFLKIKLLKKYLYCIESIMGTITGYFKTKSIHSAIELRTDYE